MMRRRVGKLTLSCSIAVLALGAASAKAASEPTSGGARDLSGIWWIENYDPHLAPMDGSAVPYTAEGQAEHDKNAAAIADGSFVDPPLTTCLLPGLPRAMMSAYPMKIVQHDRTATFIHEETHAFWHAIVGVPHTPNPDDIDAAFMGGESIARWDGDELVVDSVSFKGNSYLDDSGMPHGEGLHLVQRLHKINGGKELEDIMTIDDPKIFSKSWTARRTYEWRPDVKLLEYVCGEPHRALTGDRAAAMPLHRRSL